ncbi:MAG TPA: GNAT family N-acetyltransferase [Symbiobacteriaceae bacterium]|nr:GNAT family N-acetyltransferase [Symbiobacteriaceae bacterium]
MISIGALRGQANLALLCQGTGCAGPLDSKVWFQRGSLSLLATAEDGQMAGAILLVPEKWLGPVVLSYKLAWLRVAEQYRRQGVASALLRSAAKLAAESGARFIHAPVRPSNAAGIALFENLDRSPGAPWLVHLTYAGL